MFRNVAPRQKFRKRNSETFENKRFRKKFGKNSSKILKMLRNIAPSSERAKSTVVEPPART